MTAVAAAPLGLSADELGRPIFAGTPATTDGPLIGAELELIPVDAATRRVCPIADAPRSTLGLLRGAGAGRGWCERRTCKGAPLFVLPEGIGTITFEPGGQLELSAAPCRSASVLLRRIEGVVAVLDAAAEREGIELLAVGIDPVNPVEPAALQLDSERYARMARHFAACGPSGARMMRQTASLQVNLDYGDTVFPRWRVLNAAAPYLTALFANSAVYAGQLTGCRSYRAQVWRGLDPGRTGLPFDEVAPAAAYAEFALDAPALLLGTADEPCRPFRRWAELDGWDEAAWQAHLGTLFPEVRPRGYFEVRSIDTLPARWRAAPIVLLAGLVYHRPALEAAAELLAPPSAALLGRAGSAGLRDPRIRTAATELFELGLWGAARLGRGFLDGRDLEQARDYYLTRTRRGLDAGDG